MTTGAWIFPNHLKFRRKFQEIYTVWILKKKRRSKHQDRQFLNIGVSRNKSNICDGTFYGK